VRRLFLWIIRATSSLPTPLSPRMSTVALVAPPLHGPRARSQRGTRADHVVAEFDGSGEDLVLVAQAAESRRSGSPAGFARGERLFR